MTKHEVAVLSDDDLDVMIARTLGAVGICERELYGALPIMSAVYPDAIEGEARAVDAYSSDIDVAWDCVVPELVKRGVEWQRICGRDGYPVTETKLARRLAEVLIWATGSPICLDCGGRCCEGYEDRCESCCELVCCKCEKVCEADRLREHDYDSTRACIDCLEAEQYERDWRAAAS